MARWEDIQMLAALEDESMGFDVHLTNLAHFCGASIGTRDYKIIYSLQESNQVFLQGPFSCFPTIFFIHRYYCNHSPYCSNPAILEEICI